MTIGDLLYRYHAPVSAHLQVGHFELLEPLGRGAMGEVWLAEHRSQWVQVAVKFLHAHAARDEGAIEAFANEARAVAGLSHPGIVMVLDHGRVSAADAASCRGRFREGTPFLVMELVRGTPLQTMVGRMDWARMRDVLLQVLDALAHSHARGVIHRDIKPGNVLLRKIISFAPEGASAARGPVDALLTDFGLAEAMNSSGLEESAVAGTPAYMAPEQLEGRWRDQGPWTDLYAVGCLAWCMATGLPPYGREQDLRALRAAHRRSLLPPFRPAMPLPRNVHAWLRRLLAQRPDQRYSRAADAALGLYSLESELVEGGWSPRPEAEVLELSSEGRVQRITTSRAPLALDLDSLSLGSSGGGAAEAPPEQALLSPLDAPDPPVLDAMPRRPAPVPRSWQSPRPPRTPRQLMGVGLNLYDLRLVPVVGRSSERDRLWAALRAVGESGQAHAVVLGGSAGTGKSRLAAWLCERAHETGAASVISGQDSAEGGPSDGLPAALARHLRVTGLSQGPLLARLSAALSPHGLTSDEVRAVAELLQPGSGAQRFRDEGERRAVVRRLLQALIHAPDGRRPLVLSLDNAHWGLDSLGVVSELLLAQEQSPLPLLVVLTVREDHLEARPEEKAALQGLLRFARSQWVEVGPLPPKEHEELVAQLLGMEGELVARVAHRTAGNPWFAVQLVGDWVQRGVLEASPQGFRLREGARVDLPDDVQQTWSERVQALLQQSSPAEVLALEAAAALGQDVMATEWRAVCARLGAEASQRLVDHLLQRRLARTADGGWSFAHPMLREALEQRNRDLRQVQRLHLVCAREVAELGAGRAGVAERVARHLLIGGRPASALEPLLRAADERIEARQLALARRLVEAREKAMRRLSLPTEDALWGEGWLRKARLARMNEEVEEAEKSLERLLSSAARFGWTGLRASGLMERVLLRREAGQAEQSEADLLELLALSPATGGGAQRAFARQHLGRMADEGGDDLRASQLIQEARLGYLELGERARAGQCQRHLGLIALQRGSLEEARHLLESALREHQEAADRLGQALDLLALSGLDRLDGRLGIAELRLGEARRRLQALGLHHHADLELETARQRFARGQADQSRVGLEEVLSARRTRGQRRALMQVHSALLVAVVAELDWDAWDHHLSQIQALRRGAEGGDLESGRCLRMAADRASAAGELRRAQQVRWLARDLLVGLDRPEELVGLDLQLGAPVAPRLSQPHGQMD